jgi:DNA repair protein RadC
MARPTLPKLPKLPKWCKIVRSNPAVYERDVFNSEPITSPRQAAAMLRPALQSEEVEQFAIIALDSQHRALGLSIISRGTVDQTLVMPREVFRVAIVLNAVAIIVAHNHPSGDPTPSTPDRLVTDSLAAAGRLLDIPVFDHIIVGAGDRFTSFAQEGLL